MLVGPEHADAVTIQTGEQLLVRMTEGVPAAGRDHAPARPHALQEGVARTAAASVMGDDQRLGLQVPRRQHEVALSGLLEIPGYDETPRGRAERQDERCVVVAPAGSAAVGREHAERESRERALRAAFREHQGRSPFAGQVTQRSHARASPGCRSQPQAADLDLPQQRERSSHVVQVIVSQEQRFDVAPGRGQQVG